MMNRDGHFAASRPLGG